MGRRKPPTTYAELPNAFFMADTAFVEHGEIATAYEAACADFDAHGDEAELWESLTPLGYNAGDISFHIVHRGRRMRHGYYVRRFSLPRRIFSPRSAPRRTVQFAVDN